MATATSPREGFTDEQGIERAHPTQQDGAMAKVEEKAPPVAHLMRMNERFGAEGGNQFAAGITYFSVLSIFPLVMLLFAGIGFVLAARPDLMEQLQEQISNSVEGDTGEMVNEIVKTAIDQRGAVAGIGLLTALWSGLGWMNHLRTGISAMWSLDANEGGNFVTKKLADLVALIGLLVLLILAFGVTAVGSSSLTTTAMEHFGIGNFPGARLVVWVAGLVAGIFANFLVFWWMIVFMPRTKVPLKSGFKGALLGAVIFELIKQFSTVIIGSATGNPAGALFGPIISLMVVLYLVWRVVLYVSAWTATTKESLAQEEPVIPEPAVINIRAGINEKDNTGRNLGIGAAIGAIGVAAVSLLTRD
ncbi:YhjD/YihY/BrkB family envelope integrity protein [Corynebacterium sp. p3-SID1194]|uniref:YhjD/YihY/BrkB family envelope integrity protein n=1 Tax=Corynebacterium sp. p3-SID1194 TaxID=2916105 RepID=UPI0021A35384|nr:YhjD/YihY/BrkB family envelope integrity protein [Corynebacterium sp. p3-SID1194]MCT1449986.1 YihY/virulence factor BrkB family protein [Corynebacterium sp. p3-SID1194]